MDDNERSVAYDDWWPEPYLMSGSAHGVSDRAPQDPAKILVPDGRGDYREHAVPPRQPRRLGFR